MLNAPHRPHSQPEFCQRQRDMDPDAVPPEEERQGELEGQIVYIRRRGAELCFLDLLLGEGGRVELVVKAARVPKLIKLGDVVAAAGVWEDAATLRTTAVPRVVKAHDPRSPFVPIPAPPRRLAAHDPPPSSHCRFHLSSKRCPRGASCRHRHAELESHEFREAVAERLAAQEHARAHAGIAGDPFAAGGQKARKSQRAAALAQWCLATFGPRRAVLEVAGGTGALSRALLEAGAAATVLLVDPRAGCARPAPGLAVDARPFATDYAAPAAVDLLVALHPDQATDACLEWAAARGLDCAVVPCCVFADLFARDGRVRTYEQLLAYLAALYTTETAFLPIQGRNVVLFRRAGK